MKSGPKAHLGRSSFFQLTTRKLRHILLCLSGLSVLIAFLAVPGLPNHHGSPFGGSSAVDFFQHPQLFEQNLRNKWKHEEVMVYSIENATPLLTSNLLPKWVTEYAEWHGQQLQRLRPDNWHQFRYLLMECWSSDKVCGGTADRLRSFPFMLLVASQTNRILLIHWERPVMLEEFLLPPEGGFDWRVPDWLVLNFYQNKNTTLRGTRVEKVLSIANMSNESVIFTRLQAHDHGADYYNEQVEHRQKEQEDRHGEEPMLKDVYRYIWKLAFTPTPPIATMIQSQLLNMGLMPGQYVAAHIRALYVEEHAHRRPEQIKLFTENAINCASTLRPGGPIFVASDSAYAMQVAMEYGKTRHGSTRIVSRAYQQSDSPLHLDKFTRLPSSQAFLFYDTFVDLYLMGMSRCLTYNIGGYGKWGLLLGYNSSCSIRHQVGYGFRKDGLTKCEWMDADATTPSSPRENTVLFFRPKAT